MKRDYIIIGIISFLLTNVIAYFDEGIRALEYLTISGDWIALIIYTIMFGILPVLIYKFSEGKNSNRLSLSISGFIPPAMIIMFMLV